MMTRWIGAVVVMWSGLASASLAEQGGFEQGGFVVAGYLPEYRVAGVSPERLAPITDLIYFGLTPPADGRLARSPVNRLF